MAQKWMLMLLAFLLIVFTGGQSSAQDTEIPPVVIGGYDLFTAENGVFEQLTQYPYNSNLATSPDGRFATYNSIPQVGLDAIERTGGFSGPMATNIWLIDILSRDAQRIAGQPDPAYLFADNEPDNVIARSLTTWSPDGKGVAWTDYFFEDGHIQLGVYDVLTNHYDSFNINLPTQYGVPGPVDVKWLPSGIALLSNVYSPDALNNELLQLLIYAPDGTLISTTQVQDLSDSPPYMHLFINYQGRDYYAQYNSANERMVMMDVLTGILFETSTMPELVSINQPDSSIAVRMIGTRTDEQQSTPYLVGEIVDSAGNILMADVPLGAVSWRTNSRFYLSPDGQAFAYRRFDLQTRELEDGFIVTRGGVETVYGKPVEGFSSLEIAWGGQMWRIPDDADVVQISESPAFVCVNALSPRLVVGQDGIVLSGGANRVRDSASLSGNTVGQIPSGETFSVNGGPICADGIVWWQVEYQDVVGWTAEGVDDYFVEPID